MTALQGLHDAGMQLGKAWRLAPRDMATIDTAWKAHRDAIEQFVTVSSQVLRRQTTLDL